MVSLRRTLSLVPLLLLLAMSLIFPRPADAYSVLSHEEVVDMAWKAQIVPMLKLRFPGITDDDLRLAHAYAYGGSVIQDIGYYPFGSHYFSDLLHYVRPDEFVRALIRDSATPNEYAFALGSLAHYCGDTVGHPFINQITSDENPRLRTRYGKTVTYAEDPTAHLRTEFGFDVVMVAHGVYSQEDYRDFIGFQVSKDLLDRAFEETYGLPVDALLKHEDLAIKTYRHAVSGLVPQMTKIAFVNYKDQIEAAAPGTAKARFIYRLNQTEYRKEFGKEYTHVGFWGHVLADVLKVVPKVGPFKALRVSIPNPVQQDVYLKSVNATVDRYRTYLAQIHAAPAPLPPPDPKNADDAARAADKLKKDAVQADKRADKARDPNEKAMREEAAADVAKTAATAAQAADRVKAQVESPAPPPPDAVPAGTPVTPPSLPQLAELDMDTGKPSNAGEYRLADETYAHLLDDLVKPAAAPATGAKATEPHTVDAALAADIEKFYAHPAVTPGAPQSPKQQQAMMATGRQVQADLQLLKTMTRKPQGMIAEGLR